RANAIAATTNRLDGESGFTYAYRPSGEVTPPTGGLGGCVVTGESRGEGGCGPLPTIRFALTASTRRALERTGPRMEIASLDMVAPRPLATPRYTRQSALSETA